MKKLNLSNHYKEGVYLRAGEHAPKGMAPVKPCKEQRIAGKALFYVFPDGGTSEGFTAVYRGGNTHEAKLIGFIMEF